MLKALGFKSLKVKCFESHQANGFKYTNLCLYGWVWCLAVDDLSAPGSGLALAGGEEGVVAAWDPRAPSRAAWVAEVCPG